MYVRFVTDWLDDNSGRRQGLFMAMEVLNRHQVIGETDLAAMSEIYEWFKKNLKKPRRLAVSRKPHAKAQALSWFKDTSREHIAQMHEYGRLLGLYGVAVEMLVTERPGYIVYEDVFQVAAYPFSDTPT